MDKCSRQKINKEIQELTLFYKPLNLTGIYRILSSAIAEYVFSSARGTLSRIEHVLGHKMSLNIF